MAPKQSKNRGELPSGGRAPSYHSEQGHSPQWENGEHCGQLTPQEVNRARRRFRRNKGCQYQSSGAAPAWPMKAKVTATNHDWLGGENHPVPVGGTLWSAPFTLSSVVLKKEAENRREGWGGLPSRREYKPVFVPSYKMSPNGAVTRVDQDTVRKQKEELKKELTLARNKKRLEPSPKKWLPPPTCYDAEVATRGVGELGPIGRLEPVGWWVSRSPPVPLLPVIVDE